MTAHDMFSMQQPGRGPRRPRPGRATRSTMSRQLEAVVHDMLPLVCDDRVLFAEVGAATGCIGWYVQQILGSGESEFGSSAPEPMLRVIDEFGSSWGGDPLALVLCARALARLTASPDAHEILQRIDARWDRGSHMRPTWCDLPLVVPQQAWLSRRDDGGMSMLVTSWRDATGVEHSFAVTGPEPERMDGDIGDCPTDIVLGDEGEAMVAMLEEPIEDLPGETFERISLDAAREALTSAIDDVPLASETLLPGELPFQLLAFLEHRRDLL